MSDLIIENGAIYITNVKSFRKNKSISKSLRFIYFPFITIIETPLNLNRGDT